MNANSTSPPYTGRFAPSPTGPLHAGSLIAALASYLSARAAGGRWLVRMEDLDPPREVPGAARDILVALERLGLAWNGEVLYQSRRHEAYRAALDRLTRLGLAFPCDCSRREIHAAGGVYPGRCRDRRTPLSVPHAIRCRTSPHAVTFTDLLQGRQSVQLERDVGDFVVLRKDGFFAYQLAVAVDDAWQGMTHVIRGIDLLDSTFRHIHLQRLLGLATPRYGHIPVIVNRQGQKLSKQHFAAPVDTRRPDQVLLQGLAYLRQNPDPALAGCVPEEILRWAVSHWKPERLRGLVRLDKFEHAPNG